MIVAVAGRRIDAPGAVPPRFPLLNRALVRRRIGSALDRLGATALVSSAACGADLLALAEASRRHLRCRIVLPYAEDWFIEGSVIDRPGRWQALYRQLCAAARARGDLVILRERRDSGRAYRATNEAILAEAWGLAHGESPEDALAALTALIVWEGAPRGPDDLTAALLDQARGMGALVAQVLTLRPAPHQGGPGEAP